MQQSLDSLIAEIGNPEITPNDLTVIHRLIKDRARWFSMSCGDGGYVMSLAEEYEKKFLNINFKDLVLIVSLFYNSTDIIDRRHTRHLLKKYFKRRELGYSESTMLFPEITSQTYGLLVYREQAEKMIMSITDMGHEEANKLLRNLRKRTYEAQNYGDTFISSGVSKGLPREKVRRVWSLISRQAQLLTDYKFSLALSWLLYQLQYLETYHSTRVWTKVKRFAKQYEDGLNLQQIEEVNSLIGLLPQYNKKDIEITTHMKLWNKCKKLLQHRLGERICQMLKDVESASFDNKALTLILKDDQMYEKLEKKLFDRSEVRRIFVATLREVYGDDVKLFYVWKL